MQLLQAESFVLIETLKKTIMMVVLNLISFLSFKSRVIAKFGETLIT